MENRNFRGVLFDLDGVLAKTMDDNFEAWKAAMRDFKTDIATEDYFPLEGMNLYEIAKILCKINNIDVSDYADIVKKKEEYYLKNNSFELYPNVEGFVDYLKSKNVLMGIVTAGLPERLHSSVPLEFLSKFDVVIAGDKTTRGKPFPDPYLKGAQELGLKPEESIVVENAPLGIQAAKSAGAYCIAICSTLDRSYLEEADEIVEKFEDLNTLDVIKQLGNK